MDGLGAEAQEFVPLLGLEAGLHELGQQDAEGIARHQNREQVEPVLGALFKEEALERLGKPAAKCEHHFGVAAGLREQAAEAVEQPQKAREGKGGAFGGEGLECARQGLEPDLVEGEEQDVEVLLELLWGNAFRLEHGVGDAGQQFVKKFGLRDEGVLVKVQVGVEERRATFLAFGWRALGHGPRAAPAFCCSL